MTGPKSEEEIYRIARERVKQKRGFWNHLAVYVVVNIFLVIIWFFTGRGGGYPWFIWPLIGWGIGIIFHALGVFVFPKQWPSDWERKQVEKEAEKLRKGP